MLRDGKALTESLKVAPSVETLCFIGVAHQASTVRHTLPSATQVQIHCACPSAS